MGLTAVAREAGLPKATAYRLLAAPSGWGWSPRTSAPRPTGRGSSWSPWPTGSWSRWTFAPPPIPTFEPLAREAGHSALAGVLEEGSVVYVDIAPGRQPLRVHTRIGARRPLHVSSIGKAITAFLPAPEAARALDACDFAPHTAHTIADRGRFEAGLEDVRRAGWAMVRDEDAIGTSSVAEPVLDWSTRPAGAVAVALPTATLTDPELGRVVAALTQTCRAISSRPGPRRRPRRRASRRTVSHPSRRSHRS